MMSTQHTLIVVTLHLMTQEDKIAPALKDGKNVFVGAHGNSIRALVKHFKGLSDDEIMDVEIPNFPPLVFGFDEKLNVVSEYYLGK